MAEPSNETLKEWTARVDRELKELRARVVALERLVGRSGDHAADRSTVREKVSYDWQG